MEDNLPIHCPQIVEIITMYHDKRTNEDSRVNDYLNFLMSYQGLFV